MTQFPKLIATSVAVLACVSHASAQQETPSEIRQVEISIEDILRASGQMEALSAEEQLELVIVGLRARPPASGAGSFGETLENSIIIRSEARPPIGGDGPGGGGEDAAEQTVIIDPWPSSPFGDDDAEGLGGLQTFVIPSQARPPIGGDGPGGGGKSQTLIINTLARPPGPNPDGPGEGGSTEISLPSLFVSGVADNVASDELSSEIVLKVRLTSTLRTDQ